MTHTITSRVRYAETDQMGVVYHANYLPWMEMGRVEFFRALGHNYKDMEAAGTLMAVVEVQVRYHAPARYDDEITISTSILKSGSRGCTFHYEIRLATTTELLASGQTKHLFVGPDFKPARVPTPYRDVFVKSAS